MKGPNENEQFTIELGSWKVGKTEKSEWSAEPAVLGLPPLPFQASKKSLPQSTKCLLHAFPPGKGNTKQKRKTFLFNLFPAAAIFLLSLAAWTQN